MLFVLGEHLLRRRAAIERDCENHTAKESDAMKKLLAQLQRQGAEGADHCFAWCTSPGMSALSMISHEGICHKVTFGC